MYWLYERLTLDNPPQPADIIFVLAGRMDRKQYGIELYRAGLAPRLLLSIGRYEVSKMATAGFEGAEELIALRNRTPPERRHFFCEMGGPGIRVVAAIPPQWNTYGEIVALRKYFEPEMPRSMIVISSDVHLRRVATTVDRVFRDAPPDTRYCAAPAGSTALGKRKWWQRSEERRYVVAETIKLAAYRAILSMPEPVTRRLMGLKDHFHSVY